MSFPVGDCPVCGHTMTQTVPGAHGTWSCPNHGDFTGGTGSKATPLATVQAAAVTNGKVPVLRTENSRFGR